MAASLFALRLAFALASDSLSASEERSLTDVQEDVEGELRCESKASSESCEVATELEAGLSISEADGLAPALDEPPSGELEPK